MTTFLRSLGVIVGVIMAGLSCYGIWIGLDEVADAYSRRSILVGLALVLACSLTLAGVFTFMAAVVV